MNRDPRYDILFEPVPIGPVTAKNRFYQVPHCNGMGFKWPQSHAKMREVKAEGGWAVICTEECMIHPTSDGTPYPQGRLWDEGDVELLALFADGVHRHGALAGVELVHHGQAIPNLFTREYPIAPCDHVNWHNDPVQARAMDKADIRALRQWHRQAAKRAKRADIDLVYVYAAHDLALPQHFLSRRRNQRSDEYGGSLKNRARLLRELIEDTKDTVGDRCGVVVRFAVDERVGPDGITAEAEAPEVIEMLGELPDMWDVNISDFSKDAPTSQFQTEGHQEPYVAFVKTLTTKPVVGVGWFTSPDTMASQVRRGVLDMIGCARPSIADPFLPKKIEEGRIDDIRECIACNICVGWGVERGVPMRCTQNPSVGEEWRRDWHPERIPAKGSDDSVLVVGAGPAGLEAARARPARLRRYPRRSYDRAGRPRQPGEPAPRSCAVGAGARLAGGADPEDAQRRGLSRQPADPGGGAGGGVRSCDDRHRGGVASRRCRTCQHQADPRLRRRSRVRARGRHAGR